MDTGEMMGGPMQMPQGDMGQMGGAQNMSPDGMPGMAPQAPPPDMMSPMEDPTGEAPEVENDNLENIIDFALSQANLAKKLKDKEDKEGNNILDRMGQELFEGYTNDESSREAWLTQNEEWLKLALLIREQKTWPWPKASNIKFPLMATAAMQFSARAYPALVPADGNIVKAKVVRKDKQGIFQQKAIRVAAHMSYQVMCKIPNWEEDMDKLLMTMAISGICFKETFYNAGLKTIVSQLVYPENFCVNYNAKSIESAYRKTRIMGFTDNEIKAKVARDEEFLDIDYGSPVLGDAEAKKQALVVTLESSKIDKSTPHTFLAIHTFWDLDEDGYEEPYIVTIHKETQKVVKIVARWDSDGVEKDGEGKIISIKPVEYFTDYPFIPNPDGSLYALGFGALLGPINESVNTIINQLIDSGTLNNLSGGFIGKNLRIKMGQTMINPGEWRVVNATGEELQKSFFPIPTKEPSNVLNQLMNMLVTSGNQLASIAEIMVGKMPGQNTPAGTTQEAVQQGMAVFTAIYKRVYRSLSKEFKKIFRLNRIVPGILDEEIFYAGQPLDVSDYEGTDDYIIPGADPTGDSANVRAQKMQMVVQMMQMGTLDPMAVTKRNLEVAEIPNFEELLAKPPEGPPPPSPEEEAAKAKMEMDQQAHGLKMEAMQKKAELDAQKGQQDVALKERLAEIEAESRQSKLEFEKLMEAMRQQGEQGKIRMNLLMQAGQQQLKQRQDLSNAQTAHIKNAQKIRHGEQQHQQKMAQQRQLAKAKPKNGQK